MNHMIIWGQGILNLILWFPVLLHVYIKHFHKITALDKAEFYQLMY